MIKIILLAFVVIPSAVLLTIAVVKLLYILGDDSDE